MKFYRDLALEALKDAKDRDRLRLLDADWFELRLLQRMEEIESEADAATSVGALVVIVAQLIEKVRSADPVYGLTPVPDSQVQDFPL